MKTLEPKELLALTNLEHNQDFLVVLEELQTVIGALPSLHNAALMKEKREKLYKYARLSLSEGCLSARSTEEARWLNEATKLVTPRISGTEHD